MGQASEPEKVPSSLSPTAPTPSPPTAFAAALAARLRIALQRRRREAVKQRIVSRVYRHQLAEDMAGQFADHQPLFRQHAGQIVAVSLAFRGGGRRINADPRPGSAAR